MGKPLFFQLVKVLKVLGTGFFDPPEHFWDKKGSHIVR